MAFENIEIGKKGILAHQQGMSVIGHNLSNSATQGYSRQKVNLSSASPLTNPSLSREQRAGQIGQGVNVVSIQRVKDEILESRIDAMASQEQYYSKKEDYLQMLSDVYNEPEDASVRKAVDNFWVSLNELSKSPSESFTRENVVQVAKTLTDSINKRYYNLKSIQDQSELEIKDSVKKINDTLTQIANLSKQIKNSINAGDNPNDLMDKRDVLTEKLGGILPITVNKLDNNFSIYVDGENILSNEVSRTIVLKENKQNEGYMDLSFKDTGAQFLPKSGSLGALISLRDGDIKDEIKSLDNMVVNMVSFVNDIHRQGYTKDGQKAGNFFKEFPFVNNGLGNFDANSDGQFDSTYIFSIKGTNALNPSSQVGLKGTLTLSGPKEDINIDYNPTDTIRDLMLKINHSGAEVSASLDKDGYLILKGTPSEDKNNPDFVIRNFSDSGDFLVGYSGLLKPGQQYNFNQENAVNSLDGKYSVAPIAHPAGYLALEDSILYNSSKVASGQSTSPGDGKIALALASLRNNDIMLGKTATMDDYFANSIASIGIKTREAMTMKEEKELNIKDLRDYRESISGVNINEEISDMMKFQHGYNASARFLVTVDKMLDTIINLK